MSFSSEPSTGPNRFFFSHPMRIPRFSSRMLPSSFFQVMHALLPPLRILLFLQFGHYTYEPKIFFFNCCPGRMVLFFDLVVEVPFSPLYPFLFFFFMRCYLSRSALLPAVSNYASSRSFCFLRPLCLRFFLGGSSNFPFSDRRARPSICWNPQVIRTFFLSTLSFSPSKRRVLSLEAISLWHKPRFCFRLHSLVRHSGRKDSRETPFFVSYFPNEE